MISVSNDVANKYVPWIRKKTKGKPQPVKDMMYRANGTAMGVLSELSGVPFAELSSNLYFIAQDMRMKEFTRLYEAELELASIDQDKFVKEIYKFFNDISRQIKKDGLYQEFFEFASLCNRYRYHLLANKRSENTEHIINAYQSMLLETFEFIRPNKFDFSQVVVGLDTKGEVLLAKDIYPYADVPIREMQEYLETKKGPIMGSMEELMAKFFAKHGYLNVKNMDDVEEMMEADRIYTHQHTTLSPYINEYTYDILPDPDKPVDRNLLKFLTYMPVNIDMPQLKARLMKRARTLPANGTVFELKAANGGPYRGVTKVLLRETMHGDDIILLYKMELNCGAQGELSGCYNTREQSFYSILQEAKPSESYFWTESLVLYLYACAVLRDGDRLLSELNNAFRFGQSVVNGAMTSISIPAREMDVAVSMYSRGGKLKRSDNKEDAVHTPTGVRRGNDAYESEERAIQGFIRKVGAGWTPSPEAVARATALGFDLAPDETYVQPFIKSVLKLKAKAV